MIVSGHGLIVCEYFIVKCIVSGLLRSHIKIDGWGKCLFLGGKLGPLYHLNPYSSTINIIQLYFKRN